MYTIKYHQTPLACLPGVDIHAGYVGVQVVIVQAATALALVPRVPGLALALEPVHLTNQRSVLSVLCPDNQSEVSIVFRQPITDQYWVHLVHALAAVQTLGPRRQDALVVLVLAPAAGQSEVENVVTLSSSQVTWARGSLARSSSGTRRCPRPGRARS